MSGFLNPPLPTDDAGAGAADLLNAQGTSLKDDFKSGLGLAEADAARIGKWLGSVWDNSQITEKGFALLAKILSWIVLEVAKAEAAILDEWVGFEAQIYKQAVTPLENAAATEAEIAAGLLLQAMGGTAGQGQNFGSGPMAAVAQQLFNAFVQPFTLISSGLDPKQHGSGIAAQQYLLEKALTSSLQEWIVDQLGNHLGMGFFKTLGPFLGILDRSINPANVVRRAMDASFTFMLQAPLTRDLNRAFPYKDLGVTALAKLFLRGAIDQATYLDRCLDSGLDSTQAQQLILETARLLDSGTVAKLLNAGYITGNDASNLLSQAGFQTEIIPAQLYYDTHARYFAIQERVGYKAVTAWQKGFIDQSRLETLLSQLGFTQDEITLLELEGEFVKETCRAGVDVTAAPGCRSLTQTQVKDLFLANIIGIDQVITFLENQGYSQADVINLVLLDFTVATERAARRTVLEARLRVAAQADLVAAQAEQKKNELALAAAKLHLAAELEAESNALGSVQVAGSLQALLSL